MVRLIEFSNGRIGIYQDGVGTIVDGQDTMLFKDGIQAIYKRMTKNVQN
jgi:hypothetical protein